MIIEKVEARNSEIAAFTSNLERSDPQTYYMVVGLKPKAKRSSNLLHGRGA
jgi:hypothetical protein